VGEGLVAAASALMSSLLLFGRPERKSLSLLPERASASHPSAFCCSAGPPTWGVVRTRSGDPSLVLPSEARSDFAEGGVDAEGVAAPPPSTSEPIGSVHLVACVCFLRPPRPKHIVVVL
jgi:hypothetical protein